MRALAPVTLFALAVAFGGWILWRAPAGPETGRELEPEAEEELAAPPVRPPPVLPKAPDPAPTPR
ncbi:MAG: hypothetical protein OXR73_34585, partial [Myxococcales bacterium]|nr:hypothetical protein [Myxococcales bacterium]